MGHNPDRVGGRGDGNPGLAGGAGPTLGWGTQRRWRWESRRGGTSGSPRTGLGRMGTGPSAGSAKGTPSCECATATTVSSNLGHRSPACFACSAVRPPGIGRAGRWNVDGQSEGRRSATRIDNPRKPWAEAPRLPSLGRSATPEKLNRAIGGRVFWTVPRHRPEGPGRWLGGAVPPLRGSGIGCGYPFLPTCRPYGPKDRHDACPPVAGAVGEDGQTQGPLGLGVWPLWLRSRSDSRRLPGVSTPGTRLSTPHPSRSDGRSRTFPADNRREPRPASAPRQRRSPATLVIGRPRASHAPRFVLRASGGRVGGMWMDRARGVAPRRGSITHANRGLKRHGYPRWVAPRLLRNRQTPVQWAEASGEHRPLAPRPQSDARKAARLQTSSAAPAVRFRGCRTFFRGGGGTRRGWR
jgi:hypothetical protein